MNAPRLLDAIGARGVGGWLAELRRDLRASTNPPAHARFDPVRVEAEFYDAIYGQRSGTVENIATMEVRASRGRGAAPRRGDRDGGSAEETI